MKRKIKRKLFLMGMVVSAGFPSVVLAKGSSKLDYDAYLHASHWHGAGASTMSAEGAGDKPAGLFSKMKTIVDRMSYGIEKPGGYAKPRGWQLEMLQPAVASDLGDAPHPGSEKRFGIGLRVAF